MDGWMRVASSRVMSLITNVAFRPGRNQIISQFSPIIALSRKFVSKFASTRDLNWKRRGRKKRKNRTDPVSVREPSVNKWEGGDIEMKQGGKSGFRATISGKIDELPVGGQPVLCP